MKYLLILFLCSCSPCRTLVSGDKVNLGDNMVWTHGIVIKNSVGDRKLLVRINECTYQVVSYWDVIK
jgi:hypothetical protein